MTPSNLLELAKQGDARAIAQLINQSLQPNGITATATVKNGCLEVILEAELLPKQKIMANFIYQGTLSLKAESITSLVVSGKKFSHPSPSWSQTFDLGSPNSRNIATAANLPAKNLSSNTPQTIKKSKPVSQKASRSGSGKTRLEKIVDSVTEEPLSLEEVCEERLREIGRFPREGYLSLSYYYAIPKLAKSILNLVQSPSEIIEAIPVRYQGELAALLLTDKYLACFFFPDFCREAKKAFVFIIEQVEQVSLAPNGLIVHPKKYPVIKLFFQDKNLGQELRKSQLSKVLAMEKSRRIAPGNYEVTLNLFGFLAFFLALGFNLLAIYLVIQHILVDLIGLKN